MSVNSYNSCNILRDCIHLTDKKTKLESRESTSQVSYCLEFVELKFKAWVLLAKPFHSHHAVKYKRITMLRLSTAGRSGMGGRDDLCCCYCCC